MAKTCILEKLEIMLNTKGYPSGSAVKNLPAMKEIGVQSLG